MENTKKTVIVRKAVESVIGKNYREIFNDRRSNNIRRLKFDMCDVTPDQINELNEKTLPALKAIARQHTSSVTHDPALVVTFEID